MKFYDETKPLYKKRRETRSNTSCHRDDMPDNSILRPIAFSSKSLVGMEKIYSNRKKNTMHTLWIKEISPLLLCERGEYHSRSQAASCNIQKRWNNTVTKTVLNSTEKESIQSQNHIQAWNRPIYSRLALQTKLQGKQRYRNTWHADKC